MDLPGYSLSKNKNAAKYWTQSLESEFAGKNYRFVVVRSSNLDKRKEKKLEAQLQREYHELQELQKKLKKEQFQCKPDAKARLEAILKDHDMLHKLTGRIIKNEVIKRRPGRPRKDQTLEPAPKTITTYEVELEICAPTAQVLDEWCPREATFVLMTSESQDRFDDYDILKEYKGQINVEMRFRFLKDPMFVNAIFLKTPKRVQALGYVILLAVMIAALLEIRIREALKNQHETITGPGKRVLDRPTARVLLDMLNAIQVVYLTYDDRTERHLPQNIDPDTLRLLRLAGYDERIYTQNPYKNYPKILVQGAKDQF